MAIELVKNNLDLKEGSFSEIMIVNSIKNLKEIPKNPDPKNAMLIDTDNAEEAKRIMEKLYKRVKLIIVQGRSAEFNRKILENKKVNILLSPEKYGKHDKLYERDSGLNHVLCKIAKENNITIAMDIKEIVSQQGEKQAKYLARVMQNIKLCKKYQVKMILTSFPETQEEVRSLYDIQALARVLGMDTKMAQEAIEKPFLV